MSSILILRMSYDVCNLHANINSLFVFRQYVNANEHIIKYSQVIIFVYCWH